MINLWIMYVVASCRNQGRLKIRPFPSGLLGLLISLLCGLPFLPMCSRAQALGEAWTSIRTASGSDQYGTPSAMTLDGTGNVYVAVTTHFSNGGYRLATIKYDSQGNELWSASYGTNSFQLHFAD